MEMRGLKQRQWLRVARDQVVLKEDKEFAFNGKQKGSVQEETSVVSDTTEMSMAGGLAVPKACAQQAAADPRGSRACVCAITLYLLGWHKQERKCELTSCSATVWSSWQIPPVRRKEGRPGCPQR